MAKSFYFGLAVVFFATVIGFAVKSAPALSAPPSLFGTNLIYNEGAEMGSGAANNTQVVPIPRWETTGHFTAVTYGADGSFPTATSPGPPNRGKNFFSGGPGNEKSTAEQTIDLSGLTGSAKYELSGYLGGFSNHEDEMIVTAEFVGSDGTVLGSAKIGPVTHKDRNDATGLMYEKATGVLPSGTSMVRITMESTRTEAEYNDGFADNLSFVLSH